MLFEILLAASNILPHCRTALSVIVVYINEWNFQDAINSFCPSPTTSSSVHQNFRPFSGYIRQSGRGSRPETLHLDPSEWAANLKLSIDIT